MNQLYACLLTGLRKLSHTHGDDAGFERYLQSLQPYVINLRGGYRNTRNSRVKVDYSDSKTQAAYLMAYYPIYAEMTYRVLQNIDKKMLDIERNHLNVCLFGAGPAPEIPGLLSYISEKFPQVKTIHCHIFDIAATTWSIARNITLHDVVPQLWKGKFELTAEDLDFCQPGSFTRINDRIAESHLFIFQNCLNELPNPVVFNQNITHLINTMAHKSMLIIADLRKYDASLVRKKEIEAQIRNMNDYGLKEFEQEIFSLRGLEQGDLDFKRTLAVPPIVRNNLLTGADGLIPRSHVNCSCLAISKVYQLARVDEELSIPASAKTQQSSMSSELIVELQAYMDSLNTKNEAILAQLTVKQQELTVQLNKYQIELEEIKAGHGTFPKQDLVDDRLTNLQDRIEILERSLQSLDLTLREFVQGEKNNIVHQLKTHQTRMERRWAIATLISTAAILISVLAVILLLIR